MITFNISPNETDWWGLDYSDFLANEGSDVTISSATVVGVGNVAVDDLAHPVQVNTTTNMVFFWADATGSSAGDHTTVTVTLTLSNAEIIPRTVKFYTKVQ